MNRTPETGTSVQEAQQGASPHDVLTKKIQEMRRQLLREQVFIAQKDLKEAQKRLIGCIADFIENENPDMNPAQKGAWLQKIMSSPADRFTEVRDYLSVLGPVEDEWVTRGTSLHMVQGNYLDQDVPAAEHSQEDW